MVHELLGLNSNRVKLKGAPGVKDKDLEEVVLSATDDAFYAENKFANFGDLGMAVKDLLDDYQRQTKMNENISSIEDMQSFMERYPAFRSKSLNVTKHVALIGELSRLVDVYKLMDVSQLEQDVACNDDKSAQWREVLAKLNDAAVKAPDKLRLAMLYALRYESAQASTTDRLKLSLEENRVNPDKVALLDALLAYGGKRARGPGLFDSNKSAAPRPRVLETPRWERRCPSRRAASSAPPPPRRRPSFFCPLPRQERRCPSRPVVPPRRPRRPRGPVVSPASARPRGPVPLPASARGPVDRRADAGLLAKFSKQVKSSLEGIENVYAQHVPLLMETLDAVAKGKLNAQHYPAATTATPLQGAKHDQVIVYIVGGVTYEEATKVAELNAANAGVSVVLGGSFVHNSGTFLEDLDDAFGGRR